jgi:ankyrin repeat protein
MAPDTSLDICLAAQQGDLATVQRLVTFGISVNQAGHASRTPLHEAASHGHRAVVLWLLANGAKVNARSKAVRGENARTTPLHCAVEYGHGDIANDLLAHGADPNIRKSNGHSALADAIEAEKTDLVALLLAQGANPSLEEMTGATALDMAAASGNLELVEQILHHKIDFNRHSTKTGKTALMYAAFEGFPQIVETLLNIGAKVDAHDKTGRTALHYCVEGAATTITRSRFITGVGLVEQPQVLREPLECARLLLSFGANPNASSVDGRTPLQISEWFRVPAIQGLLEEAARRRLATHVSHKS